mgnify:FL=1|nr:MAG TPA: structural protein [Caudoviricetes sp.]
MARFAIKDVMDLKLTPLSGRGEAITIDYLNGASITWDEESTAAKKKGRETIIFGSPKTGEFKIDAEIIDDNFLALMTGGTLTSDVIEVGAVSPTTMYSIKGTFAVVEEGGEVKNKEITLYSAKPKASGELNFSAEDVANFSITFTLASNSENKFMTYKDASLESLSAKATK